MAVRFRNYTQQAGITDDYCKVRAFLVKLGYSEFVYARWDWMATHSYLDKSAVGKIGLWEDNDKIVGIATFDTILGNAYCLAFPDYSFLKKDMVIYSKSNLRGEKGFGIVIPDTDLLFQDIAAELGFIATPDKENDSVFYIDKTSTSYTLPSGFRITSMKDTYDRYKYRSVLWKGFNHELKSEGELKYSAETDKEVDNEMMRPFADLNLKIAVVNKEGDFVSYCGMWYEPETGFAIIEPVATDPAYRKAGLGKAAVLEGIKRVGQLGAKIAFVGSHQQFYYSIGLRPYATSTIWKE